MSSAPDQVIAFDRTFLAHERTMMAWIRMSTSLITFGFGLYKFFHYVHEQSPARHANQHFTAREYGVCMMAFGVLSLVIATWQYRRQVVAMRAVYHEKLPSLPMWLAGLVAALGGLALTAALLRQ